MDSLYEAVWPKLEKRWEWAEDNFADGGRAGVFCCKPLLRLCIGTAFFGYHLFFSLVNQAV